MTILWLVCRQRTVAPASPFTEQNIAKNHLRPVYAGARGTEGSGLGCLRSWSRYPATLALLLLRSQSLHRIDGRSASCGDERSEYS
jgi:hypothetical protein